MATVEIKDASKVYKNGTKAMDHISLTIHDGEYLCIIGLSGAGKSTLLRSINRLNEISEGEILIDGKSITKASKKELKQMRTHIGLISQQFNLVKRSTVLRLKYSRFPMIMALSKVSSVCFPNRNMHW